jgi:hypothetical protein
VDRDEICSKAGPYLAERLFASQRSRGIYGHHLKNFFSQNAWEFLLKSPHLIEQAQGIVARETVGSKANVESQVAQALE